MRTTFLGIDSPEEMTSAVQTYFRSFVYCLVPHVHKDVQVNDHWEYPPFTAMEMIILRSCHLLTATEISK